MRKLIPLILLFALSCHGRIDQQPPKTEVAYLPKIDTAISVTVDSGKVEAVIVVDTIKTTGSKVFSSSVIDSIYMSQVGVHEATGHNDGKDVEKYLRAVHLTRGSAWCAAFVKWCFDQAGVKTTITGWSPTAHNPSNIVLINGQYKKSVQPGDVFTIYFSSLKRIGHTGFVRGRFGMNSVQTVEGNTNVAGSREGDGVYVKVRPKSTLYSITRWF